MSDRAARAGRRARLRLFVAGESPSSLAAQETVREYLNAAPGTVDYELVDVLREPGRALEAELIATPTLIVEADGARRRYVGDLRDQAGLRQLLHALGVGPAGGDG